MFFPPFLLRETTCDSLCSYLGDKILTNWASTSKGKNVFLEERIFLFKMLPLNIAKKSKKKNKTKNDRVASPERTHVHIKTLSFSCIENKNYKINLVRIIKSPLWFKPIFYFMNKYDTTLIYTFVIYN